MICVFVCVCVCERERKGERDVIKMAASRSGVCYGVHRFGDSMQKLHVFLLVKELPIV